MSPADRVVLRPETFTVVLFDHAEVEAELARLVEAVFAPPEHADVVVEVDVDERIPLRRARLAGVSPVRIEATGGALEDPRRLRQWSRRATVANLGGLLVEARDRLDPAFAAPPLDDELSLAHRCAWDAACLGRLQRLGYDGRRDRARYAFRNRHGFTDRADAAFDRLWAMDRPTWDDVRGTSDAAAGASDGPAGVGQGPAGAAVGGGR